MNVRAVARHQLAKRAPKLEKAIVRARWRSRNRARAAVPTALATPGLEDLLARLSRDGIALGTIDDLFGSPALFEEAAAEAQRLLEEHDAHPPGRESVRKPYLSKLLDGSFETDDVFARIALHPNVLAIVNSYMKMRCTLRALDLWLTEPTPGDAIETQLWHRDGDDLMNVKLFVYFTKVTRPAGPYCYAPRTHPPGDLHTLPERDANGRSRDEQMEAVSPRSEWVIAEGERGTIMLTDTCGYHKQLKPESERRLVMMAQYVSGTPLVPRALEIRAPDGASLSEDQRVAVFDGP